MNIFWLFRGDGPFFGSWWLLVVAAGGLLWMAVDSGG